MSKSAAMDGAFSKVAVDETAKEYFVAYFRAYGAQLTRDIALKTALRMRGARFSQSKQASRGTVQAENDGLAVLTAQQRAHLEGKRAVVLLKRAQEEDEQQALKDKVKSGWQSGKSLQEMMDEMGIEIDVRGSIADFHQNIINGDFFVKKTGE